MVDVSRPDQIQAWAEQMLRHAPPPDLLVNNASLINQRAPLWDVPSEEFSQVLAVNVTGVVHVLQAFLPGMLQIGRDIFVNVSSSWGRGAEAGLSPYLRASSSLRASPQALARELPPGLAAVSVAAGLGPVGRSLSAGAIGRGQR